MLRFLKKNELKISILVENAVCDLNLKWEWWVSMFIEFGWKKILWDSWQTDIFLENAKNMKINLDKTDFIVLSHFHSDHTWWLKKTNFADNKKIIAHSRVFDKVGEEIKWNYEKIESKWVYEITKDFYFLWEIPRVSFEKWIYGKDKMLDDTALAIKTKKWLVIVAGCSHSGIVNICEYAKKIAKEEKIYSVIWWMHLLKMWWVDFSSDEIIDKTINYFEEQNIEKLYPFHCVDFEVLSLMKQKFGIKKKAAGDVILF